ncbi:PREDICTED: pseudouridine-metabolizing bifunctional protein C1861.05-like isoform X2 [Priapulus caudatus]|nr:PREDICTED: pseudouridine-metabolizing bifunctional protein C1861.05-like isoform X2 [Priapulus caudatus]
MYAAASVGIPVFVTGGIGGVHRGVEHTMDISTDLTELGRTEIAVVSAGVKSILDIGRTLEYLETLGVSVITYAEDKEFPAFFTRRSGFQSPYNAATAEAAAELIFSSFSLGLRRGVLVAVPIPEQDAASSQQVEDAIQRALAETRENKIKGKDVTPYILQRVNELTEGKSLQANISLIKNNAKVGAQIACAYAARQTQSKTAATVSTHSIPAVAVPSQSLHPMSTATSTNNRAYPVVVGATNRDITICGIDSKEFRRDGSTNLCKIQMQLGGVGRNISEGLLRLGNKPIFITATGRELTIQSALRTSQALDARGLIHSDKLSTGSYVAILNHAGELAAALGDMEIHDSLTPQHVSIFEEELRSAPIVCFDANIPPDTIRYICDVCAEANVAVWFEPTDTLKAANIIDEAESWRSVTYTSPNVAELLVMGDALGVTPPAWQSEDTAVSIPTLADQVKLICRPLIATSMMAVFVTLGARGVLVATTADIEQPLAGNVTQVSDRTEMRIYHYPACNMQENETCVSVSGAGDSMVATIIAGMLENRSLDDCVKAGLLAAAHSLHTREPIPTTLTPAAFTVACTRSLLPWKPQMIAKDLLFARRASNR